MSTRDFLQRFRPAGAPGPAAGAGVPADRITELTAELAPVFALLDDVEAEAAQIRREATVRAERRREESAEAAARLLAEASAQAEAVRAEAFAAGRAEAEAASTAALAAAREDAEQTRRRAAHRMPGFVTRLVDLAVSDLTRSRPTRSGSPAVT